MSTLASPSRLDLLLQALADPTRRAILSRLSHGETRVTDLAKPFSISLNSVSKHIRILERVSLVTRRRAGREHVLAYNPAALDEVAVWVTQQREAWNARFDALERLLLEDAEKEGLGGVGGGRAAVSPHLFSLPRPPKGEEKV